MRKVYTDNELIAAMRELGWISLKMLAAASGVPYNRIVAASRLAGADGSKSLDERYDWAKIEELVRSYLDSDKGLPTIRAVVEKALADKKRAPARFEVIEGKKIPKRKYPHCEIGQAENNWHPKNLPVVLLRGDMKVYAIAMQTRTNTVLRSVDADGNYDSEFVRNFSNFYLNLHALPPEAVTRDAVMERLAGAGGEAGG